MTPSLATTAHAVPAEARRRVLVLRSCRPHVFESALNAFREQAPGVDFVALSHPGHAAALRLQGVSDTIEVPGQTFGLMRLPFLALLAIRRAAFDAVLVPVMWGGFAHHLNLLVVALATASPRVIFYSPDQGVEHLSRREAFRGLRHAIGLALMRRFDVPVALALMLYAVVAPRRKAMASGRPKRVLHVISSWGVGGAQRQLAELAQHYPADSFTPDVFVLSGDGDFATQHLRGHHLRIIASQSWPYLSLTMLEVARLCRREQYDVVHTWLFKGNVVGVSGARLAGINRVISSVRNLSLWKRIWDHRPWFRVADTLASRASDVVTVNGSSLVPDHAGWAHIRQSRIVVVPNGLSLDGLDLDRVQARQQLRDSLGLAHDTQIVGTVGRLAPEKDHAMLLDAWFAAAPQKAHLVIVGDGQLRFELQARIRETGAPITLLGASNRARQIMAGLDLFVLPSRIEGFPNVLLEAAMLGVPVLTTDVGAARDMVLSDEDLVPVSNARQFAARLTEHLTNPEPPRRRAAIRREFVRQTFTITRMVDRWLALYDGADR